MLHLPKRVRERGLEGGGKETYRLTVQVYFRKKDLQTHSPSLLPQKRPTDSQSKYTSAKETYRLIVQVYFRKRDLQTHGPTLATWRDAKTETTHT